MSILLIMGPIFNGTSPHWDEIIDGTANALEIFMNWQWVQVAVGIVSEKCVRLSFVDSQCHPFPKSLSENNLPQIPLIALISSLEKYLNTYLGSSMCILWKIRNLDVSMIHCMPVWYLFAYVLQQTQLDQWTFVISIINSEHIMDLVMLPGALFTNMV